MTTKIQISSQTRSLFQIRGVELPPRIWAAKPFMFAPSAFVVEHPRLKPSMIQPAVAEQSYQGFCEDPTYPWLYVVAGQPDDAQATLFAAHLVEVYLKATVNTQVTWHQMHSKADLVGNGHQCSLLVISGLYPDMTSYRLERVRDLVNHYDSIPRILVVSGEDPIAFARGRLFARPTSLFFKAGDSAVRKEEVI